VIFKRHLFIQFFPRVINPEEVRNWFNFPIRHNDILNVNVNIRIIQKVYGIVSCASAEIREAFKVFDRDGNGFISKQELGVAMRSLGYMPNEVELEVIIQRLDMDGILALTNISCVGHTSSAHFST